MCASSIKERVQRLQRAPGNIRNICILAHVDHGKTTLADSLVASNGIISQRQAGKLRYMDDREDEQLRGITMKSSAIALQYASGGKEYLVNLIDSPGHVDFSSEVSTGLRLCDGAVVVVDAVEGVCAQTQVVLQQAWVEGIKPCLVINKVDRLILELHYTPTEAYYHLQQILEQVNAVTGTLFTVDVMEAAATSSKGKQDSAESRETKMGRLATSKEEETVYNWSAGLEETDDSSIYFAPEHDNVVFASAIDGWGFGVSHFADLYAKKLGIRADVLHKTLWGDYYLNSKSKRIFKGAQAKCKKPLFVQFVLDNIWAVYEAVIITRNKERIDKIVSSMNLKISARDSRHSDPKVHLSAIFTQWLPLAPAVLTMIVNHLPSPLQLQQDRVEKLMSSNAKTFDSFPMETQLLREDFLSCSQEPNSPTMLFVSKLFSVERKSLPQHQVRPLTDEEIAARRQLARQSHQAWIARQEEMKENDKNSPSSRKHENDNTSLEKQTSSENEEIKSRPIFLAFSRVYSGVIRRGQRLHILQPRYDPRETALETLCDENLLSDPNSILPENTTAFTVNDLFILMGREVVLVDEVPAGNIVGIAGMEEFILKSATVSSTLACPAFRPMLFVASPIVRVAIEPVRASDMPSLIQGMKLLNQADPSVEVYVQETGEHVLATAGEVHLQKCVDDLQKVYAKVELKVSAPIIPFRETVIPPPKIDMVNEVISSENEVRVSSTHPTSLQDSNNDKDKNYFGYATIMVLGKAYSLKVEALSLPAEVTQLLEENSQLLRSLSLLTSPSVKREIKLDKETVKKLFELKEKIQSVFRSSSHDGADWTDAVDHIWSFGPKRMGPNILLNRVASYNRPSIWTALESDKPKLTLREYDNSIVSGFQLTAMSGPLCEEPMHGVCFVLREWSDGNGTRQEQNHPSEANDDHLDTRFSATCSEVTAPNLCPPEEPPSETLVPLATSQALKTSGPSSGQLISAMKEASRRAFLARPARLMAAMYKCHITAMSDILGRLHGVIGRCSGRVLSEEMKEGSVVFSVEALIPVAESFGFAEELRKKTSGLASPQLVFSHWEVIPEDPFWVPSTEEELLHFGEKADSDNTARGYINAVRRRKGLHVDEKIVEHAEKQRTLKKNK